MENESEERRGKHLLQPREAGDQRRRRDVVEGLRGRAVRRSHAAVVVVERQGVPREGKEQGPDHGQGREHAPPEKPRFRPVVSGPARFCTDSAVARARTPRGYAWYDRRPAAAAPSPSPPSPSPLLKRGMAVARVCATSTEYCQSEA